jgi:hypothetical protein
VDASVKALYQAIVVRYVHDVLTGEFVNVGLVVLCPARQFVACRFLDSWTHVTATFPTADPVSLRRIATAFERACDAAQVTVRSELPFEHMDDVVRLVRGVMPFDDSAIQFSDVIGGITADPAATLCELFGRLVGRYAESAPRMARDDKDIWQKLVEKFPDRSYVRRLERRVIRGPHLTLDLTHAWKNGMWHAVEPVSFDLVETRAILDKATKWTGRILTVRPREQDTNVILVVGMPSSDRSMDVRTAANDGLTILNQTLRGETEVVTEDQSDVVVRRIITDLDTRPTT